MSETQRLPRPLPRPDSYLPTRPFWDGTKSGKLLLQYCPDTGRYQWYPRPVSLYTGKRNWEWRAASGRGTLYSWTLTFSAWPGHEDRVPYLCAYVDLEERVRILCNIVNAKADALVIGMPMRLAFETLADGTRYPVFEPAA